MINLVNKLLMDAALSFPVLSPARFLPVKRSGFVQLMLPEEVTSDNFK